MFIKLCYRISCIENVVLFYYFYSIHCLHSSQKFSFYAGLNYPFEEYFYEIILFQELFNVEKYI